MKKIILYLVTLLFFLTFINCSLLKNAGLIAHYTFDDPNNIGKDYSGNNLNGITYGNPILDTNGISGNALILDGINDYIRVPNDPLLNPQSITIAAWVKATIPYSGIGSEPIIDKPYFTHEVPFYQYHLSLSGSQHQEYLGGGSAFQFYIYNTNGSYTFTFIQTNPGFYQMNEWYFLTGIYDYETQQMKLYINGTLYKAIAIQGMMTDFGKDLFIGKYGNLNNYLLATVDEIRIYNYPLSENEIYSLYTDF
ncbi:LamG domain-containing protein [candidate division WOR-3 bacterium]|nr:LamG domain-containing protein [candidate division WOR-3 bacterium]